MNGKLIAVSTLANPTIICMKTVETASERTKQLTQMYRPGLVTFPV